MKETSKPVSHVTVNEPWQIGAWAVGQRVMMSINRSQMVEMEYVPSPHGDGILLADTEDAVMVVR